MSENTKPDGGPAFPTVVTNTSSAAIVGLEGEFVPAGHQAEYSGMTLRDYFAARAMQAMLSNPAYFTQLQDAAVEHDQLGHPTTVYWLVASLSQDMADEMIAARDRRSKP